MRARSTTAPAALDKEGAPSSSPGPARSETSPPVVRIATAVVVVAAIAWGAAERLWVGTHPLGTMTSDGAVIGLMALHLLHHGQLPAYFWGQSYGGSLEVVATAGAFLAFGTSTASLLATAAVSSALATLAMWWASRAIVGHRAALLAALAWWAWSPLFAWRSLKPGGTYLLGMALAWLAVGLLARVRAGDARAGVLAAVGVATGLALWSSPVAVQLLVPAAIWCVATLRALSARRWALLACSTALGALPAIWFGATHAFSNLLVPGASGGFVLGAPERLAYFFWLELPILAGGRVEGSWSWVLGLVGVAVTVGALAGFVATARAVRGDRASRCRLGVLAGLCLPILYSLNQDASVKGQGRYAMVGASMVVLLVGVGLDNLPSVLARRVHRGERAAASGPLSLAGLGALAVLVALGSVALHAEPAQRIAGLPVGGVPMPFDDAALRSLVADHHVTDAYSGYWLSYRLTFETEERTVAVPFPFDQPRYAPLSARVAASPHPAYLFVATSPTLGRFESWCASHHLGVTVDRDGDFVAVVPATRVLPSQVPQRVLS